MLKKPTSLHEKEVFTTGDAADACFVSQQTIIRCFDSGQLRGFRVPGSRFRRIPRANLIKFMRENGIPMDALEPNQGNQLHILAAPELMEALAEHVGDARTYNTSLELGMAMHDIKGTTVVDDRVIPSETDLEAISNALCTIRTETPDRLRSIGVLSKEHNAKCLGFDEVIDIANGDEEIVKRIVEVHNN